MSEHGVVSHEKNMRKILIMNLQVVTILIQRCRGVEFVWVHMQMDFWYYVCVTFYLTNELLPEISFQVILVWYVL